MFLTFIPSNGPICLSKCVCCVLFPARFVPMPSLQWAPLSPGVRAEASRYLYRPNSWGPPSQSSEGWVEKLSWKLQVKPSVGNFSLPPLFLFLTLLSSSPSFIFLPWVSRVDRSGHVQFRSAGPPDKHHLVGTHLSSHVQSFIYLSVLFSFYSLCNWCFSPHFYSLKDTLLPGFQLKSWLFWTEQEKLIFPPIVPQHILSFCCTGQSQPAVAELSFLCFFPFLLLRGSCGACPFLWISRLWSFLLIALHLFHPVCTIISSLDDPALHSHLFLMWTTQEGFRLVNTSFSSRPFSQSDVPSQACWANERWRDINLIAVRDRYIDRGGCNKLRHDCWLPVRLAFQRTSRFIHWF